MDSGRTRMVYVVGHKNPDTDSTCAAIAYAHFKNLTDKRFLFTPGRAGKLNEETTFILERFGVSIPNEIESLTPTVSDLDMKKPVFIQARESVQALAQHMKDTGVRAVPVVDDENRLAGIVGLRDIARHYMDSVGFSDLSRAPIELDILVKTLDCRVISNVRNVSVLTGKIFVAAMQKGTILNLAPAGAVVIAGDQRDIQLELIQAGCSTLIVTDGFQVDKDVISAAEKCGALVLSSPRNAFGTLQLLTMAEPVSSIMSADCPTVGISTNISTLRKRLLESEYRSAIAVDADNRVIGFITRTDILNPIRKRAILVDHNEISQAVDGIEDAEILEIIDHHRVGDISTVAPIFVYNDPVGSTCTVVASIMFLYQVRIPLEIAGLLLSGILSDTLILNLSTTTEKDRMMAERLAEIAGVSIQKYGRELLHASINIEGKSPAELINADFKEFLIGDKKLGVSQMMVFDCEQIDLRESELLDELERIRVSKGYDLTALLVTNPLSAQRERVLLKGATWIVEKAFGVKVKDDTCILPRVMSRKKDFIPAIGQALSMARSGG